MTGEKIYTLIDDITKVRVSLITQTNFAYKPAESERVVKNWYGKKVIHPPKPERWIFLYDNNEKYLTLHDNEYDWKTRKHFGREYSIDEQTKKVTKRPYVMVELKSKEWITLDYFDTNEEALKFGQKILNLRPGKFI
jgi:hypothetical protein